MSISTSREEFAPHTGDHESDIEYSGSIEDFSVPEPVAARTGIDDISEYNGFEHRGETFLASEVVSAVRHGLYFEHSHHGNDPKPQSHIRPHSAIDRVCTRLGKRFEPWFSTEPEVEAENCGEAADEHEIYESLYYDDLLRWDRSGEKVPYAKEAHRQIVVSAIALLLDQVEDLEKADTHAQKGNAKKELQKTLVSDVYGDLSKAEALEIVEDTFDRLEQ